MISKFSKFSKKELVISGCSMVSDYVNYKNNLHDKNYYSHTDESIVWENINPFNTIDYYLANSFNLTPVNISKPGSGNEQIFFNSLNYITKNYNRIKCMIICWTELSRIDIRVNTNNNFCSLMHRNYDISIKSTNRFNNMLIWNELYNINAIFPLKSVETFLSNVYLIDLVCKNHDIICIQCSSLQSHYFEQHPNVFFEHHLFDLVNSDFFYGWPYLKILGGKVIFDKNNTALILSDKDRHPNNVGHKYMADILINFIKKGNLID